MRQKFIIKKNTKKGELNIKEYINSGSEYKNHQLSSKEEPFSMICEETYDNKQIVEAIEKGKSYLVDVIRTDNLFPIIRYARKIADTVIDLYDAGNDQPVELFFDDKEFLSSVNLAV